MNQIKDYLKQIGKRGGEATKKKNPNHFKEIGKKGAEKRWGKCKVCGHIHEEVCKCGCPAVRIKI